MLAKQREKLRLVKHFQNNEGGYKLKNLASLMRGGRDCYSTSSTALVQSRRELAFSKSISLIAFTLCGCLNQ
ncbi:unnamed protein product [Prunus armeniaca]|uniref:Uncharacterized protein n=1 Tax=Prunus armeniaca TaxID=36596 RepID=A0A6J5UIU6_PRUAR|nr:unnamed protein product [Prunus armeniaca]CAB4306016.1 unnamed protein product [Prunus armeniaca]